MMGRRSRFFRPRHRGRKPPAREGAALALALLAAEVLGCQAPWRAQSGVAADGKSREGTGALTPALLLSGSSGEGFARATGPVPFSFPADHGPHPAFRTEWWYFTGILHARASAAGAAPRRFGYQFTIFRQALAGAIPQRDSAWASRDTYMAHLTVSDLDAAAEGSEGQRRRFHAFEKFARDGLGLAGARAEPFAVWVESWRMSGRGGELFPVALQAGQVGDVPGQPTRQTAQAPPANAGGDSPAVGLELMVSAGRGPILQGDQGWSVKGSGAGNASYYYSCTRLPTEGKVTLGRKTFEVTGTSWLDREWSTSALDADVVGWDWLGVHLDDGRDLMLYRLRTVAGGMAPASRATLIEPDGSTRVFGPDAFSLTPRGLWTSADGQARYPAGFLLSIPSAPLELTIRPLLTDQELVLAVRYWEGAVTVASNARRGERPVGGSGYMELTGYVGAAATYTSAARTLEAPQARQAHAGDENCVDEKTKPLPTTPE